MQSPPPNRVKEIRTLLGQSIETLAAQVGITPNYLRRIENETAIPSLDTARKITAALGATRLDIPFPAPTLPAKAIQAGAQALSEGVRQPGALVEVSSSPLRM